MKILEETAFALGARLCRDAIWFEDRCNWLGPSMEALGGQWAVVTRSLGPDLYAGTAGIGWFLALLFERTGDRLFRQTALGALTHAASHRGELGPNLSFYSGRTGIECALLEGGIALGSDRWQTIVANDLSNLAAANLNDQSLDVVTGLAGAIPALLRLRALLGTAEDTTLALATRCADRLHQSARQTDGAWSWTTIGDSTSPNLTGFSHGSAGFGWAFLELLAATGDDRYRLWANAAFQYERGLFDADQQNWPDLRPMAPSLNNPTAAPTRPVCALAWCHGAPGIGLSRLRAYELTGDPISRAEAEIALATTLRDLESPYSLTTGFSLCHGSAGNAELLLEAARILDRPALRTAATTLAIRAAETFEATGEPWPCGVNGAGESPSLLLGLAGIAYFYLRLLHPDLASLLYYGPGSFSGRQAQAAA